MYTKIISISISIMVLILILSANMIQNKLSTDSLQLSTTLESLENNINTKNWEYSYQDFITIKNDWEEISFIWKIIIEHAEIDQINESLNRLEKYIESKSFTLSLAECYLLKNKLLHIPEKESFILENIF